MEKTPEIDPTSYKLLLACPSGYSPEQVMGGVEWNLILIDFRGSTPLCSLRKLALPLPRAFIWGAAEPFIWTHASFDRVPHPDNDLEDSISEIWNRRIQENPSLYNGKKFRYGGYSMHDVGVPNQESSVCLHLGLTDYRTFVGTNLNPLWEKFLVPSEDDSIRCQCTASPLGNGAVVETADKKILVLQRSYNVGEFPGHFVFPGGHSEPEEIGLSAHHHKEDLTESGNINNKVSQEMFDGIIREVVEEIGVPSPSLTDPVFIGISRRELNVRPTAFFFLKCNLKSQEIQQLYSKAQDGYESTQLYTVSRGEVANMALRMPGCHQGGFALYELMMEVAKDI